MISTQFISKSIAGALIAFGLSMTAQVQAESAAVLDVEVHETISAFEKEQSHAREILDHAKAALVCPKMRKGGIFGIGGGRGHCALLMDGKTDSYYNYTAAKAGFLLGYQSNSMIMVFNDISSLEKFTKGKGKWEVGIDASVTVANAGVGGKLNTDNLKEAVVAYLFGEKGLILDATLEGGGFHKVNK